MGHKRKRQSDSAVEDPADQSTSKVQVVEDPSSGKPISRNKTEKKAKSARKQLRSERKAKKAQIASENAKKKKLVAAENLAAASALQKGDGIAGGEDFVPLTTEGALELLEKEKKQKKQERKQKKYDPNKKVQRASPRSIRKAVQAAKASSLTTEEYGSNNITTDKDAANSGSQTAPRFICFVGNLPYSCTTEQVQAHFRKLNPKSIRHPSDKDTGKSKGFAFLEFHDYDKMKTCLKLYHHSIFEPQRTAEKQKEAGEFAADLLPRIGDKKNKGRMLNVELTVGGGGRGGDRRKKILEKNVKLEKQRAKARVKAITQERKEAKKARQAAAAEGGAASGANDVPVDPDVRGDIHPSRLNRVKG